MDAATTETRAVFPSPTCLERTRVQTAMKQKKTQTNQKLFSQQSVFQGKDDHRAHEGRRSMGQAFGAGPEERVPLKLPLKTKSGPKQENKKAGQMFVATAERTIMLASCFVFCSSSDSKQRHLNRECRKPKTDNL